MIKKLELTESNSCLNKALDDEQVFVILGRDPAAYEAIRAWCMERVRLGLNKPDDQKINDAMDCAMKMSLERDYILNKVNERRHG